MKINKILIANRSEIACRIIKACKELGIRSVAVYSEIDENAKHVKLADEAVLIGPPPATSSYLNQEAIINAAVKTGCDAVHPGYGFLAENPDFNQKVRDAGLIFIGPSPEPMRLLGSKIESRKTMSARGVPLIPGMTMASKNIEDFEKAADEMGYPVLIKASAGGGGKGMRIVREKSALRESVEAAMRESLSAFGSDEIYLEKYIESPRHIEFQIAADGKGNFLHLFERECSIQRRHQKIIEESPSVALDPDLRKKMGETAVEVAKAANYDSVGTVEFLLDKDKNFYFLEVNARIQVEHPVTEAITGIDLVKLQIQIAEGKEIPFKQEDLRQNGHAIECRIYAEDPDNGFMPSSGEILFLKEPEGPGVRYDGGILQGSSVSIFYDPILAKLIAWGKDRPQAVERMLRALKEYEIGGIQTNIPFLIRVMENEKFKRGEYTTAFIEENMEQLKGEDEKLLMTAVISAALTAQNSNHKTAKKENAQKIISPWKIIRRQKNLRIL